MIAVTPDRRPADTIPRRWADDPRRVAVIACVLLVTLRLFIGWQLAYEGLWKVRTLDTPRPWTSEGYLANAQGPLRDTFRNMTGDPDDLGWLDYDTVNARWNDYYVRFLEHHPDLSDAQKRRLQELFVGPEGLPGRRRRVPRGRRGPGGDAGTSSSSTRRCSGSSSTASGT